MLRLVTVPPQSGAGCAEDGGEGCGGGRYTGSRGTGGRSGSLLHGHENPCAEAGAVASSSAATASPPRRHPSPRGQADALPLERPSVMEPRCLRATRLRRDVRRDYATDVLGGQLGAIAAAVRTAARRRPAATLTALRQARIRAP